MKTPDFFNHKCNCIRLSIIILLAAFGSILLTACGQDDDQRDFENEAFSLPEGFTETDGSGQIVDENEDPDDWRTAPFFQGLVLDRKSVV